MGKPKKGQLHQVMFPLVDATDFASIESAITSGLTCKFYGVNHGGSAAMTSGTASKAASVVHSGIFRLCLKTTENNYDNMLLRVTAAGCADQILTWENADYDDSDLHSAVTATASDLKSQATVMYAMLSDLQSDFQSRVPKAVATNSQLSDLASDLKSYLAGISGMVSDVDSALTSQFTAGHPLNASDMSDLRSAITVGGGLLASGVSDIESRLASRLSDILSAAVQTNSRVLVLQSMVSDVDSALTSQFTAGHPLNASDLSDIRSAVLSLSAMLSDTHSAATQASSRALVVQSMVSDVDSALTSQFTAGHPLNASDMSDIRSAIGGITATLSASDISDLRSAITASTSDIKSAITASTSDVKSAIGNVSVALTASDISDIASAVAAAGGGATQSQVQAIVTAATSDIKSQATTIYNMLSDLQSDFQSRVPSQVATPSQITAAASDIKSAVTAATSDVKSAVTAGSSDVKSAVLATHTLVTYLAPPLIGTIANAGEGTETYVYGGVTVTYTVDEDGNRAVVAIT